MLSTDAVLHSISKSRDEGDTFHERCAQADG